MEHTRHADSRHDHRPFIVQNRPPFSLAQPLRQTNVAATHVENPRKDLREGAGVDAGVSAARSSAVAIRIAVVLLRFCRALPLTRKPFP